MLPKFHQKKNSNLIKIFKFCETFVDFIEIFSFTKNLKLCQKIQILLVKSQNFTEKKLVLFQNCVFC